MQMRPAHASPVPLPLARLVAATFALVLTLPKAIQGLQVMWEPDPYAQPKHGVLLLIPENVSWTALRSILVSHGVFIAVGVGAILCLWHPMPRTIRRIWEHAW